jgi:molybdopterin molybdotransferase
MIPFRDALKLLLEHVALMDTERIRIEDAAGRVLRHEIRADRDFPSFDRVMMDGYAMRAADFQTGRRFHLTGCAPAGQPAVILADLPGACVEVMTGAPLPIGADCIVPVEDSARSAGEITVSDEFDPVAGRFIHRSGSDAAESEILLQSGVLLGSREIGVAASCGAAVLVVSKLPDITILPTGDELVAVDAMPAPHQIRQSNGHAIRASLKMAGFPAALREPLTDDAAAPDLGAALESSDWLILTGAVSKGARDFLPGLLDSLGCRKLFHGVAQRPGKPAGFWLGPRGQAIMALPGNPVSALTGLHAFVLPALAAAAALPPPKPRRVIPAETISGLPGMTRHLPVTLGGDGRARPAPTGNSGDFIGLLRGDGFVTVPPQGDVSAALPFTHWT